MVHASVADCAPNRLLSLVDQVADSDTQGATSTPTLSRRGTGVMRIAGTTVRRRPIWAGGRR